MHRRELTLNHAHLKRILLVGGLSLATTFAHALVRTTSYCPQEPGGFRGCTGERLQPGDCAADLNYYPIGTRLVLGGNTYTVADCGSAVRGPNHIDIYCPTRRAMNARGTIYLPLCHVNSPSASKPRTGHPTRLASQSRLQTHGSATISERVTMARAWCFANQSTKSVQRSHAIGLFANSQKNTTTSDT